MHDIACTWTSTHNTMNNHLMPSLNLNRIDGSYIIDVCTMYKTGNWTWDNNDGRAQERRTTIHYVCETLRGTMCETRNIHSKSLLGSALLEVGEESHWFARDLCATSAGGFNFKVLQRLCSVVKESKSLDADLFSVGDFIASGQEAAWIAWLTFCPNTVAHGNGISQVIHCQCSTPAAVFYTS